MLWTLPSNHVEPPRFFRAVGCRYMYQNLLLHFPIVARVHISSSAATTPNLWEASIIATPIYSTLTVVAKSAKLPALFQLACL